jgi:phage terminase large subunit
MQINVEATSIFERNYEALFNSDCRIIINQGGSRSSKTVSVCQLSIVYALKNKGSIISICRKTLPALKATIMRDFFGILDKMGLYDKSRHNKTENIYTFSNGSIIEFFSTDNQQKLRGRKRNLCIIEEANEIWEEDYFQLNLRTIDKIICMYNPSDRASWLYDLDPNITFFIKSTYHDNPFLEESIIKEIEALKDKDEALYTIFALGERAITRENIYSNWEFIPLKPERFTQFIYGIDYGFTNPTALVKVWYWEDEVFVEDLIYESNLTSSDIIRKLKEVGVQSTDTIIAEVARPEINEEIRRANFHLINADKNVKGGINDVQRTKVYTNSRNVWKEYENYTWKKVGGQLTEEPVKILDDIQDALRYSLRYITKYLKGDQKTYTFH